jgi:hypothetical protein
MNAIEPFGSTSTYRKCPGKGDIRHRALSAVMNEVALLPRKSWGERLSSVLGDQT